MANTQTEDKIVNGMDWGKGEFSLRDLNNYRDYQYDLIGEHIGKSVFEVGTGDRAFTEQIVKHRPDLDRLFSIEPSTVLWEMGQKRDYFPDFVEFGNLNLFDVTPEQIGKFDTAVFIHVLEHIEQDRAALDHTHSFLEDGGKVLIEVPALPFLYSGHDEMLGHFRRYTKKMLRDIVDPNKYNIKKLWYQDPIGVFGSYYFFKLKKIKLKSDDGRDLAKNQGGIYDKYIIPFEKKMEKYITFPFGLSVSAVLEKK